MRRVTASVFPLFYDILKELLAFRAHVLHAAEQRHDNAMRSGASRRRCRA